MLILLWKVTRFVRLNTFGVDGIICKQVEILDYFWTTGVYLILICSGSDSYSNWITELSLLLFYLSAFYRFS